MTRAAFAVTRAAFAVTRAALAVLVVGLLAPIVLPSTCGALAAQEAPAEADAPPAESNAPPAESNAERDAPPAEPGVPSAGDGTETETSDATPNAAQDSLTRLDGSVLVGRLLSLDADGVRLEGQPGVLALWELSEIQPSRSANEAGANEKLAARVIDVQPLVRLRGGHEIAARVLAIHDSGPDAGFARLRLEPLAPAVGSPSAATIEFDLPISELVGFRLREAYPSDDLLERDLRDLAARPDQDTLYLRRQGLFRFRRPLRALDAESLWVEDDDRRRSVRRVMVQGVVLAPIAPLRTESDPPATLELPGVGLVPAYVVGAEGLGPDPKGAGESRERVLIVRLPGAPDERTARIPFTHIRRILLASDRVLFLSQADPIRVEESPVLGAKFPYQRDRSVTGAPIRLGGREHRRGLGVRSRSILEYALDGSYRSFASVIGLDASSEGKGSVTFRVFANGEKLLEEDVSRSDPPVPVSLSIEGATRLRLEVDYGDDALDFFDHADWADARVAK